MVFFETVLGREHPGKVSKKLIGKFYFWGITLMTYFDMYLTFHNTLQCNLKECAPKKKSFYMLSFQWFNTYPPRLKPLGWCVCCCWAACGGVIPIASTGELLDEPLKVMKDINKVTRWISAQPASIVLNIQKSRKFL